MKRMHTYALLLATTALLFLTACEKDTYDSSQASADEVPAEVIDALYGMGFNPDGIRKVEGGYLIERDILITEEFLDNPGTEHRVPGAEQYHTNNLVATGGQRTIRVYIKTDGFLRRFAPVYGEALDLALTDYNAENLELTFQRVSNPNQAEIVIERINFLQELIGVLGSAGFPTANGDPFNSIVLNGRMHTTYGFDREGIATVIAHEMGHCIGFRHTDYFDRSISCGGDPTDEGDGGVGANQVPGTPSGADLEGNGSWMLSCSDGSARPFTSADKTALDFLY